MISLTPPLCEAGPIIPFPRFFFQPALLHVVRDMVLMAGFLRSPVSGVAAGWHPQGSGQGRGWAGGKAGSPRPAGERPAETASLWVPMASGLHPKLRPVPPPAAGMVWWFSALATFWAASSTCLALRFFVHLEEPPRLNSQGKSCFSVGTLRDSALKVTAAKCTARSWGWRNQGPPSAGARPSTSLCQILPHPQWLAGRPWKGQATSWNLRH